MSWLTEQGQTLYARARSQVEEAYRKIEADFTPEKTQQLMLLLTILLLWGASILIAKRKHSILPSHAADTGIPSRLQR
ncbi:homoprotocatechuate degradative operon repressor [Salmonella enterica subsp. enterica]|nr:homoprotocatechuate degradative operon repressor [Salmonella enterica subsp. enterica]